MHYNLLNECMSCEMSSTNPSVGMNIDFKLKYGDSYIREEEDRLEEIKAQVTNGGQI